MNSELDPTNSLKQSRKFSSVGKIWASWRSIEINELGGKKDNLCLIVWKILFNNRIFSSMKITRMKHRSSSQSTVSEHIYYNSVWLFLHWYANCLRSLGIILTGLFKSSMTWNRKWKNVSSPQTSQFSHLHSCQTFAWTPSSSLWKWSLMDPIKHAQIHANTVCHDINISKDQLFFNANRPLMLYGCGHSHCCDRASFRC